MPKRFVLALAAMWSASAAAAPPSWTVEPGSTLGFAGSVSGDAFAGRFNRWAARIRFDPANLAQSRVTVVVATASARTGDPSRDEALPGADWFAARAFPTATFRTTAIRAAGAGRFVAQGILAIRAIERPVSLPFTLAITGDRAVMRGSLRVDRRWFGIGQGQFASPETIAADVRIDVSLTARKQP